MPHGGNFTVGVATLPLPSELRVEVWYPANGAVTPGSDTYDARSFLPPALQSRLAGKVHTVREHRRDAQRARGRAG